jgi:uncharacterized protein
MKKELITFKSKNNHNYFYDPLLKEIFIYSEDLYQKRDSICKNNSEEETTYMSITAKDVEYQLANMGQITIEMTEKCNLNCLYCAYGNLYSNVHREGVDIKFSLIKNILVYLVEKLNSNLNASANKPFYISFYGGEPTIAFDYIKKTVDFAKNLIFLNNRVIFSMTTNGFFLDKYMDYFKENNFRLLISLDGDRKGNRLRVDHNGKTQFNKIFSNIKLLQSKYPDYFKNNVNFNAVLNKYNSVESITDFIEKNFKNLPKISDINSQGLNPEKISEFYNIYSSSLKSFEEAEKIMNIKEKYFIHHPIIKDSFLFLRSVCNNSFIDYNSLLVEKNKTRIPTGTCLPFFKRMFVSANGIILPCENVSHDNPFGYVNEKGVHIDTEKIAAIYNNAFKQLSNQCKKCYGKEICSECIFQMEKKFECTQVVKKNDLKEKFSRAMTLIENNPELYSRMMKEVCVE